MTRSKASVGIVRFLCQPSRFGVFRELPGQWAPTSPGRRHGGGREQMVQRAGSGNRRSSCGGRDAADEVEALRPHAWGGRGGEFSAYPVLLRRLPFSLSALSVVLGDDSIAELDGAVLSGSRSTFFFFLFRSCTPPDALFRGLARIAATYVGGRDFVTRGYRSAHATSWRTWRR